ncbi:uncharacterized protein LOC117793813 [Drosophila innubila]|uniref:uncharacterized protein LOC117793813 n=1 Tax=Drosophila innubila TaxID=198719 RepID=UPI00148E5A56|nr:uncharacterized protein LOC117793813 [Drosophila innubila]
MYFKSEYEDKKDISITQATFAKGKDNNNVLGVHKTSKACKREFLEETDQIEIRKDLFDSESAVELENFDLAVHDVWVVQCPKGVDPSALTSKRIKMPGRRYVDNLQVRTTHFSEPVSQSIGYVNARGKYTLRQMPLVGHMIVSKRLNMVKPSADDDETNAFPKQSKPPKFRLPERHPFFGRNYKERIEVNKKTSKKLRHAEKKSAEATINLRSASNYYSIRSKMLASTQTLEQKEHDIRQSVLTGVSPKFLNNAAHPNYVDLTNDDKQEEDEEVVPVKQRKRKANGVDKSVTNGNVDDNDAQESAKKKKKRKTEETATKSNKKLKSA